MNDVLRGGVYRVVFTEILIEQVIVAISISIVDLGTPLMHDLPLHLCSITRSDSPLPGYRKVKNTRVAGPQEEVGFQGIEESREVDKKP